MKITVDLDYDAVDSLFLQILYDGYEAAYFCHEEDIQKLIYLIIHLIVYVP